jgi:hypothetical protein
VDRVRRHGAKYGATQHIQLATVNGVVAQCRADVQALHKPNTYAAEIWHIGGEWKIARHKLVSRGTHVHSN